MSASSQDSTSTLSGTFAELATLTAGATLTSDKCDHADHQSSDNSDGGDVFSPPTDLSDDEDLTKNDRRQHYPMFQPRPLMDMMASGVATPADMWPATPDPDCSPRFAAVASGSGDPAPHHLTKNDRKQHYPEARSHDDADSTRRRSEQSLFALIASQRTPKDDDIAENRCRAKTKRRQTTRRLVTSNLELKRRNRDLASRLESLQSVPIADAAPDGIDQDVLQAALNIAWEYSKNGVEGHRAGHILAVGPATTILCKGYAKGHTAGAVGHQVW